MNKKKAIKIATASAIAASAFVAPVASQAAVNYSKLVKDTNALQTKAYNTYVAAAKAGDLLDANEAKTLFNNAKAAYVKAASAVKKAPAKDRAALRKSLDAAYNKFAKPVYTYYVAALALEEVKAPAAKLQVAKTTEEKKALVATVSAKLEDSAINAKLNAAVPAKELFAQELDTVKALVKAVNEQLATLVEITKATGTVKDSTLTVDAEIKNFEGKEAVVKVYAAGDTTKPAAAEVKGAVKDGKVSIKVEKLPTGKHKFVVEAGDVKGAATDFEITTPAEAKVESVNALNLREVEVKFNKELNADQLAKVANYVFGTSTTPATVKVSDDKKSVVLTLAHANALGNYSTTNKLTLKKDLGFAADVVVENIKATDTTVPTAQKVELVGPRELKVTFSEPLNSTVSAADTVADFKLSNGTYTLDSTYASYSGNTLTIRTLADIPEGSYTLAIASKSVKDSAGYAVAAASLTFDAKRDTAAPTATLVSSTETSATIKFSKAINKDTLVNNANIKFTHTYNTSTNEVTGAAVTNPSGDNQTFVITFGSSKPFPPGATTLYMNYVSTTGTTIKDLWNNAFALTTLTINTTADTVKPEITAVEFVDSTKVKVTFSEDVDSTTALTTSNYVLKDPTGTAITVSGAAFASGSTKVVELTTGTINGGAHTLEVKNVKDTSIAANVLVTATKSFTATDKVAPTVVDKDSGTNGTQVKKIADKKVKIEFSEAMDAASITDKAVYKYDGAALPTDATVEATDANKAVIITLPASGANFDDTKDITLARVKDAAGNWIEAFSTTLDIAALTKVSASKVEVTGKNTVKLTIDEVVTGAAAADFEVSINDGSAYVPVTAASTTVTDGKSYITLTIGSDITDTAVGAVTTGNTVKVRTVSATNTYGDTTSAKNAYGTVLNFNNVVATDKYAPSIVSRTIADTDGDNFLDTVYVKFSEKLQASSVAYDAFTVEGYTVSNLSTLGDTVTISLTEKTVNDLTATPKVQLVKAVRDAFLNELAAETAGTAVVKTGVTAAAANVGTQGVAETKGVYTVTFANTWAANDTITLDGVTLTNAAGATPAAAATAIKTAIEANAALNSKYTVADNTAGVLTLTQKVGSATAPVVTETTAGDGTAVSAATTAGVAGVYEIATAVISTGSTAAGRVAVTVNGTVFYVDIAANQTANQVASAIQTALDGKVAGYTVTVSGATLTFTSTVYGNVTNLTFSAN